MQSPDDIARQRAHMPPGTSTFLNRRSLATAHRHLAGLLRPGLVVLDVGCGTGAITRGIAEAVAPAGRVVGVDINAGLIDEARRTHGDVAGLSFELADIEALPFQRTFDVVTAARVLQWLAHPDTALRHMAQAAKPGGRNVVLDYNHEKIIWKPEPPESVRRFYSAFLHWRAEARLDNAIADHLSTMFVNAGLRDIVVSPQHELTHRSDPDFATRIGIWAEVAASRGHQLVADGAIIEAERAEAEADYRDWIRNSAEAQVLYLLAVDGRRPS